MRTSTVKVKVNKSSIHISQCLNQLNQPLERKLSVVRNLRTQCYTDRIVYTGGILQRLDTDVHSAVTAKTSTAL